MAALTRPDLPPGPGRALSDALHDLHHAAGWPSLRAIARDVGVSPTTVSAVFSSPRLPTWGLLELIAEDLGGDVEELRRLWLEASTPAGVRAPEPALIAGRRAELARVRRHVESGTGLLLVTGEAGIGKTRLVDTVRRTTDVLVARGCGLPLSTAVPLLPIATALRTVHETDRGQWLKEALVGTAPFVRAALTTLLPELGTPDLPPGDGEVVRRQLLAAVGTTLAALRDLRPLALLVEDLHWSDVATLELLEHLLAAETAVPIVGTFRVDDPSVPAPARDWLLRVRRLPAVETVELPPLSRAETEEQLDLLLPRRRRSEDDAIFRRSRGLPLFTEQLAGHTTDEQLPSLLAEVLDQRVSGLDDAEHAVVRALAVADRPLAPPVLEHACRLPGPRLSPALQRLDARRLLAPADDEVALRHPLLAEAVRRRLLGGESAEAHRSLAEALAQDPDAAPAEIAAHWQGAADAEHELSWRLRAAQVALARGASIDAAEQWTRALDVWPDGDDVSVDGVAVSRAELGVAAVDLLEEAGRKAQAFDLLDDLVARAGDLPGTQRATIQCRASLRHALYDDLADGLAPAGDALTLLETQQPSGTLVDLLDRYAHALVWAGRESDGVAARLRALEYAREIGDTLRERTLLIKLVHRAMAHHDAERARAEIARAWDLAVLQPQPLGDVRLGIAATDLVLKTDGSCEEMEAAGRRALDVIEAWGLDSGASNTVRANMARGFRLHGRPQRAADVLGDVGGPVEGDGVLLEEWPLHLECLALDTLRGRHEEALARATVLDSLRLPMFAVEPEYHEVLAGAELWAGQADRARIRLEGFLGSVAPTESSQYSGACLAMAARAAADVAARSRAGAAQRAELAERLRGHRAALLLDPFIPGPIPGDGLEWGATWSAELSRLAGEARPDLWAAAASGWDGRTRPHDAAYCRWRGAQAALASGQGALARRLLTRAAHDARDHVPLGEAVGRTLRPPRASP